jgi:hypothetical protein
MRKRAEIKDDWASYTTRRIREQLELEVQLDIRELLIALLAPKYDEAK